MPTISLRLTQEDVDLFKSYASLNQKSVSEMIRATVFEKIEDEYDLKVYNKAFEEYSANPVTYSHNEVKELLDLE